MRQMSYGSAEDAKYLNHKQFELKKRVCSCRVATQDSPAESVLALGSGEPTLTKDTFSRQGPYDSGTILIQRLVETRYIYMYGAEESHAKKISWHFAFDTFGPFS
jgi:hypothetical protein